MYLYVAYMCMSINNHTAYTFTYVGMYIQVRIHYQSALLIIIKYSPNAQLFLTFFEFISAFGQHLTR